MARKKKKTTKAKSIPQLNPGVSREIMALIIWAFTVLLIVSFFGAGGFLTNGLLSALKLLIGVAVYVLPLSLAFIGARLFMAQRHPLHAVTYLGVALSLLAITGVLHFTSPDVANFSLAKSGLGGGLIGYSISNVLLMLMNTFAGLVVLFTLVVIGNLLAFNLTLSQIMEYVRNIFNKKNRNEDDDFAQQLGLAKPTKMKINAKVPLARGQDRMGADEAPEPEALMSTNDPNWVLPSIELLSDKQGKASAGKPEENAEIIQQTLASFGVEVAMEEVNIGPTVTQYTLRPGTGVKLSKITELEHNLALALAAQSLRVEAPIPGKSAVGIEVPNHKGAIVYMREILSTDEWRQAKSPLSFVLGRGVAGNPMIADLAKMPHLLIAGATGSGKSIMINSFLLSLLYKNSPADLKLILVDPKQVELNLYKDIPHLLSPVITQPEKCISALKWALAEMERRYSVFAEIGKRNIAEYNAASEQEHMPYIVIVIDEMADLMMLAAQDMESLIVRLAQKARATGIHLVLATQRPSVNVITGLIKANIPARIAFSTVSQIDSRTIIDQAGSEKLLGNGDMLFLAPDFIKPKRVQGAYTDEKEVKPVTDFLRDEREPQYNEEVLNQKVRLGGSAALGDIGDTDDDLFADAARLVVESGKASASLIQRRLRVGYARAARLLDMLEEQGIVSGPDGSRPREVLVSDVSEIPTNDPEV